MKMSYMNEKCLLSNFLLYNCKMLQIWDSEFNATLMKRISKAVVTPKINAIILHEISHKVTIYDFDIIYAFWRFTQQIIWMYNYNRWCQFRSTSMVFGMHRFFEPYVRKTLMECWWYKTNLETCAETWARS